MNADNVIYFNGFRVQHILKKFENLQATKISQQIFIECKELIQKRMNTFVSDLLILC